MFSPVNINGALTVLAAFFSTLLACGIWGTETAGTPGLNTPAFSPAIASSVLPS